MGLHPDHHDLFKIERFNRGNEVFFQTSTEVFFFEISVANQFSETVQARFHRVLFCTVPSVELENQEHWRT